MSILKKIFGQIPSDGDPKKVFIAMRDMLNELHDVRTLKSLRKEINGLIGDETQEKTAKILEEKDVNRRFTEAHKIIKEALSLGPRLLTGPTFEEAYEQYRKYISHTESCWEMACQCFHSGRYAFSVFFSILTIEETGKLSLIMWELLSFKERQESYKVRRSKDPMYNHRKKHLLGAVQGALINSRIDRLLGIERIKEFLSLVESGNLEHLRQSCLYTEMEIEGPSIPDDRISEQDALFFSVLAGEIMAEVLGHTPVEWERLLNKVKEYEKRVGIIKGNN